MDLRTSGSLRTFRFLCNSDFCENLDSFCEGLDFCEHPNLYEYLDACANLDFGETLDSLMKSWLFLGEHLDFYEYLDACANLDFNENLDPFVKS